MREGVSLTFRSARGFHEPGARTRPSGVGLERHPVRQQAMGPPVGHPGVTNHLGQKALLAALLVRVDGFGEASPPKHVQHHTYLHRDRHRAHRTDPSPTGAVLSVGVRGESGPNHRAQPGADLRPPINRSLCHIEYLTHCGKLTGTHQGPAHDTHTLVGTFTSITDHTPFRGA